MDRKAIVKKSCLGVQVGRSFLVCCSLCLMGQCFLASVDYLERRPIPEGALSFFGWLAWLEPKKESAGAATCSVNLIVSASII